MNDSEELAEKYHKLFQDYTKIKAQHLVLRNKFQKEQTENAAIQAALKEKEQEVRKSLQDLDLLSFHNQRLTKRIENLQNQASAKPGGSWLMGGASVKKELEKSQSTLEAATIDLQAKIEENEKLHQQLYEINALYPRHVTELQGKIQALEKQNQELQLDVERAGVANEDTINLIRKEKDAIEKELGLIRDVLAGELKDEQRANQSLRDNVQRLETEIERLSKAELELETLQAEHSKLHSELETFKWISTELSQLQQSYNALERDKAQLEKAHAQLSQQHATLKQADENLKRALVQEQQNLKAAQEQNGQLNRDLELARGQATEQERGHINRIGQLESELGKVKTEQEQLQSQYEQLKAAEQSAKEGESRTKADLAKDLSEMKSNLENTETRVKELEQLKKTLEEELEETKKSLEETRTSLAAEQDRRKAAEAASAEKASAKREESKVEDDSKMAETEDDHAMEEETTEKEKVPLSKKARKKKAAAAAAAAVVASETAEGLSKDSTDQTETNVEETQEGKNKQDTKEKEDAEVKAKAELEAEELKHKEQELAWKTAEEALKADIEGLKAQIEAVQLSSTSKQEELSAAQAALDSAEDDKASLSSSLEMHVELTLQLQQEVNKLKTVLAKKQKYRANGAVASDTSYAGEEALIRTQHKDINGKNGDHTPQRAMNSPKDESTQVDRVDSSDKAVQSDHVELIDEGTQADLTETAAVPTIADDSKEIAESKDGKDREMSASAGRPIDNKPSRRSMIGDEMDGATTASANVNASTTNQSNREYLIKKHYETKIQNVTEQLQFSDGRYVRLHKEFELLKELLLETVQDKENAIKESEQLKQRNLHLQEELTVAKEDYRAQVETMTNFMKSLDQGR
ncbi:hypothetical protein BC939DRAFT_462309 [Gamsiella multidivaricata]|uniref:uncharacterized protein n=1 Tax=Gamsiella multidivaricata TaxID=101098 RepID=UPI00221E9AA1|nr:uncharacterized protein BC939DRAFT_462309 [Gamsiella multidivaricata]KAI7818627.1 hypothetical protein BC939DRAFT_462309 [Gamsiella multidivaricata]